MQWACAALASVGGRVGCVPAGARLIEPAEAECNLGALLAVALTRLALLDARTPGVCQLSPAHHRPRHEILLTHDLDSGAETAGGRTARVQVVELLSRCWVDTEKYSDLWAVGVQWRAVGVQWACSGRAVGGQWAGSGRRGQQVRVPCVLERPPINSVAVFSCANAPPAAGAVLQLASL
eukprot:7388758-Prymnesium_polylepis.1